MKNLRSIVIITTLLSIPFCMALAQREVSYRIVLDDAEVPKEVRAAFKAKYPNTFMSIWYTSHITYWYEDYATAWYGDWHITRINTVHTFEFPSYFEVEFYRNEQNSRAIYNRYGQWFETRTKLIALPDDISQKLKASEYGNWSWSKHKERIEVPGMPDSIYRLEVANGREYLIIRISEQGEIIQIRYD